jgi:hypothetical protein
MQHRRRVVLALLIYSTAGTEMPGDLDLQQLHQLEVHTIKQQHHHTSPRERL